MQRVTEIIDTMHDTSSGSSIRVETEDDVYHGTVTETEYTPPGADETGHVRVEFQTAADETFVVRTAASDAARKFSRPELQPATGGSTAPVGAFDFE